MLKPTISLTSQINLLKSRGLQIPDELFALRYLSENSYYHLNIYFKCFQKSSGCVDGQGNEEYKFLPDITFNHIVQTHENDKLLRLVLLGAIMPIELKLRTAIAYFMGNNFRSNCFYSNSNSIYFSVDKIEKLRSRFLNNLDSSNPIVQHHALKYGGIYPLFAIFELTSFGFLLDFFETLNFSTQDKIAKKYFGQSSSDPIKNWMKCISDLRNICAHQNYLFTRLFNMSPIFIENPPLYDGNRLTLYGYSIILGYLSNKEDWAYFLNELSHLQDRRRLLTRKAYGFGDDWKERLEVISHFFYPN